MHAPASVLIHKNRFDPGLYGNFTPLIQDSLGKDQGPTIKDWILTRYLHPPPLDLPQVAGRDPRDDEDLPLGKELIVRKSDLPEEGNSSLLKGIKTPPMVDVFINRGNPLIIDNYLDRKHGVFLSVARAHFAVVPKILLNLKAHDTPTYSHALPLKAWCNWGSHSSDSLTGMRR
jgi:hypothetical protein